MAKHHFFLIFLPLLLCCSSLLAQEDYFKSARENHQPQQISDDALIRIGAQTNSSNFRTLLEPILVPRVVGTQGHENVKTYLASKMQSLGWEVEEDTFRAETPIGTQRFTNIIARLNPAASRFLVIACHYDSKLTPNGKFIGATDSAVPCAMMLDLATELAGPLRNSKNGEHLSLKFIFFDGEEAFVRWGPTDSIYGAKHLARKLQRTPYPPFKETSHINRMDLLVLLDLLGAANPKFYSYFPNTERWYAQLLIAERRLTQKKLISLQGYFQNQRSFAGTEDDHIPFLQRGVPILHVIPEPFPDVWHTDNDDVSALDFRTIDDLNKILRVFVAEYMMLTV